MAIAAVARKIGKTTVGAAAGGPAGRVPRVKVRQQPMNQKPVITAMTIVVGLQFAHTWVVDKEAFPPRQFWVRIAMLGFGLALFADIAPKLGKYLAYLVMTGAIFDRSYRIITALAALEEGEPKSVVQTDRGMTVLAANEQVASTPITIYTGTGGAVPVPSDRQFVARRGSHDFPRRHRTRDWQGPTRQRLVTA